MSDIVYRSASELAALIQAKEISASELLAACLDRIDRYNPTINAVIAMQREAAIEEAKRMDEELARGESRGPLHGVPMTIKESYNVAGLPTTWGNPVWRDFIAEEDAVPVKRWKSLGVNLFGKTNVPIALADFQSYNEVYGTTNNPYNLGRTPGGSSGGSSAALAAGFSAIESGSDIGGSIRNPAHFCGVFGHKPTWNLLWMRGHSAPGDFRAPPDISVIGPLARAAQDLRVGMERLAGPDDIAARGLKLDLPRLNKPINELKVAVWADDAMSPVSNEVKQRVMNVAAALADMGAQINDEARPAFDAEHSHDVYERLLHATMASRMADDQYQSLLKYVENLSPSDESRAAKIFRAQTSRFREWSAANEQRHQLRWRWHEFFADYDLLISPIMPTAAFPHDHAPAGERMLDIDGTEVPYFQQVFWAGLTGVSYLPSTVIPTGLNEEGLPIGVQIIGPEYSDLVTIDVAERLEAAGFAFTPPSEAAW